MKNFKIFSAVALFAIAIFIIQGCSVSTANMGSLTASKDKDGKQTTTTYKAGETIYAQAAIANNPGKVKVKYSLLDPSGKVMSGSEVSVEIGGDGVATYALPTMATLPAGSYKLNADMMNDAGEKKDSKSVALTMATGAAPPAPMAPMAEDDKSDSKSDDKEDK